MDRARRDKDHIPAPHFHAMQPRFRRAVGNRRCKEFMRHTGLKAVDQFGVRFRRQHDPHLGLAKVTRMGQRIVVVGMHLHRQPPLGVQQLDQQRKPVVCQRVTVPAADQRLAPSRHHLDQRAPRLRPRRDDAGPVRVRGDLPTLGHDPVRQRAPQLARQVSPAPRIVLEYRFKCQRIDRDHHPYSPLVSLRLSLPNIGSHCPHAAEGSGGGSFADSATKGGSPSILRQT